MRQPQEQPGRLILLLSAFVIAGCASVPDILTDYDRDANFGAYHTYNFVEGAGPDHGQYQSLFTQYVIEAVTVEMENRGYKKSPDPDLLVNFGAKLADKIDVRTTSAPMTGGYYGYVGGLRIRWVGWLRLRNTDTRLGVHRRYFQHRHYRQQAPPARLGSHWYRANFRKEMGEPRGDYQDWRSHLLLDLSVCCRKSKLGHRKVASAAANLARSSYC